MFKDWTSEGWCMQVWSQNTFRKRKIKNWKKKRKKKEVKEKIAWYSFGSSFISFLDLHSFIFFSVCALFHLISLVPLLFFQAFFFFFFPLPLFSWSSFLLFYQIRSCCNYSLLLSFLPWIAYLYPFPSVNLCIGK